LVSLGFCVAGCGTDEADFCSAARDALNGVQIPGGGEDAVQRLRAVGTDDLEERDAVSWRVAVESFATDVERFLAGSSSEGWTTQHVASAASRVCGSEFDSFTETP